MQSINQHAIINLLYRLILSGTGKFILFFLLLFMLSPPQYSEASGEDRIDFREEMRSLIMLISNRAKEIKPGFMIIPQNAMELITADGKPGSRILRPYLNSIDGTGCEELFYGHRGDGKKNKKDTSEYFLNYLNVFKRENKSVLVIDYITTRTQALNSYTLCKKNGFISFQAKRHLMSIPPWSFNTNEKEIMKLQDAENFLYLLNASGFKNRGTYINAVKNTMYDLVIIDAFFWGKILSPEEVKTMDKKPSGRRRPVISYLSIGEAEDYRYYWHQTWKKNPPEFLEKENPEWEGNYKVKYWKEEWKEIICGRTDSTGLEKSYLKRIIDAGFDGVYLDVLDAAYYFEKKDK